jgi:hypothetical protein
MAFISIFSLLVLICHSMAAASLVTLSQGGYSNVVVGFSSQVPQPANCTDLLNNLEVRTRVGGLASISTGRNCGRERLLLFIRPETAGCGCCC